MTRAIIKVYFLTKEIMIFRTMKTYCFLALDIQNEEQLDDYILKTKTN